MASPAYDSDPKALLKALLTTIEDDVIPLTSKGVSSGNKLFGAAILSKAGLVPQTVSTNNETASPLLHGEINCIQQFFAQTSFPAAAAASSSSSSSKSEARRPLTSSTTQQRPSPRDCVFLATHEPCSLCLSGITWSGFDNFFYMFTYEDSRDLFSIPYDIDILQEVFRVPAVLPPARSSGGGIKGEGVVEEEEEEEKEDLDARPLYNRRNKFFTARSFEDLAREIAERYGEAEGERWRDEIRRVKARYDGLSDTYQKSKTEVVGSASIWK
ncbi:cytidine deoxycytidylate deaminase family protein [Xylaria sp. FL1777]|nr:cytidine deoxycytidylate deaminase family protein [Xylaria sp. FL1777]